MTAIAVKPPIEWRRPDDGYGWRAVARVNGGLLLLLGAAPLLLLEAGSYWNLIWLVPLLGSFAHKLTYVVHDCSHMALFGNRRLNVWVGRFSAALIGADFEEFTRVHWLHHRFLAQAVDPQHEDYVGMERVGGRTLAWHLLKPLLGASYYKLVLFALGKRMVADMPQAGAGGTGAQAAPQRAQYSRARTLVLIAAVQAALLLLATWALRYPWLALLYPLSAGVFGLFFSRVRSYVEHIAPPEARSSAFIRTHRPNVLDGVVLFDLNFNYHLEHHMFPWIASAYLPRVHEMVVAAGLHSPESLSPSAWTTLRRGFHAGEPGARAAGRSGPPPEQVPGADSLDYESVDR